MDNLFWSRLAWDNACYLLTLLLWVIGSFVLLVVPGLGAIAFNAYARSRGEAASLRPYISRFIPYYIYARLVDMANAIGLSSCIMITLYRGGYADLEASWLEIGESTGLLLLVFFALRLLRALSFRIWSYTFMNEEASESLLQDYLVIDWLRALSLLPLSLMLLSPLDLSISLYTATTLLVLSLLLSIVQTLRRLGGEADAQVYLFLYLCAHELLPLLYILTAGAYIVTNKIFLNIFI